MNALLQPPALLALVAIPHPIIWAYVVFAAILALGIAVILLSGQWQKARGLDKLILFGAVFYAAPVAAFGTEHFTLTKTIASMVPKWIPWHVFWAYFVGTCFIAAGLSLATKIQARLAASLLALNFFLFVALMDAPGWLRHPQNRFALALAFRELSFGAGALALAASLTQHWRERGAHIFATVARYFIAVGVLFYSFEQFRHSDHVPGIPLELVTPTWIWGHAIWTYLAAAVYAIAGVLLLLDKKPRASAAWIGVTVLFTILAVYVPYAVAQRASFDGFNYLADTLMYGGAVLMLAGAMPHEARAFASAPHSARPETKAVR